MTPLVEPLAGSSRQVLDRDAAVLEQSHDGRPVAGDVASAAGELERVAVGDLVRVRPGERMPVDSVVAEGVSTLDVSLVTSEPIPVERSSGDEVIGGSINGAGTLLVRATKVDTDRFLSQVVRHVEDARALKPSILHLVDRVLRLYTPTVLIVAGLSLVGWLVGSGLLTGEVDVRRAVFAGLGVLVMGYPCAVGIAAPLAIVRAAGEADDGIVRGPPGTRRPAPLRPTRLSGVGRSARPGRGSARRPSRSR